MNKLFDQISLGRIALQNRMVMAPMSRNRATEQGDATDLMATYYGQRATAGLIISEGVQPSTVGQGYMSSPGLYNQSHVDSWKKVTSSVHEKGGKIVAQIMHAGRIGHPELYPSAHQSIAPSAIAANGQTFTPKGMLDFPVPREMTQQDIKQVIEEHAHSAKCAIEAGFDGIELHGGNGFLIHQFLSDSTNQRSDEYGGSIEARVKFVVELVEAVVGAIGADKVGLRISPANPFNDIAESDTAQLYRTLIAKLPPLAYLHIMESNNREQTLAIREQWQGGLILNPHTEDTPGTVNPAIAETVLDADTADAVCFGALFLSNPDFVERVKVGAKFNELDDTTLYGGDHRGYTDYKTLEEEALITE